LKGNAFTAKKAKHFQTKFKLCATNSEEIQSRSKFFQKKHIREDDI